MTNPCKNCITFPMCKSRFEEYFSHSTLLPNICGFQEKEKCPLIEEFQQIAVIYGKKELIEEFLDRKIRSSRKDCSINQLRRTYGLEDC